MNCGGNIRLSINNFYEMACQVTPVSYPWWLSHWLNCCNGIKHDHRSTGHVLESGWCLERMTTKKCANRAVVLKGLDTASCFVVLCLPSKLPWLEMHLFYGASTFFLEQMCRKTPDWSLLVLAFPSWCNLALLLLWRCSQDDFHLSQKGQSAFLGVWHSSLAPFLWGIVDTPRKYLHVLKTDDITPELMNHPWIFVLHLHRKRRQHFSLRVNKHVNTHLSGQHILLCSCFK